MENTIENKTKFFAVYWGQKVLNGRSNAIPNREVSKFDYLLLKNPFNFDSNSEDAKEGIEYFKKIKIDHNNDDNICTVDFLRSKGYALPYMGINIEKLLEYGWIKLV